MEKLVPGVLVNVTVKNPIAAGVFVFDMPGFNMGGREDATTGVS